MVNSNLDTAIAIAVLRNYYDPRRFPEAQAIAVRLEDDGDRNPGKQIRKFVELKFPGWELHSWHHPPVSDAVIFNVYLSRLSNDGVLPCMTATIAVPESVTTSDYLSDLPWYIQESFSQSHPGWHIATFEAVKYQ